MPSRATRTLTHHDRSEADCWNGALQAKMCQSFHASASPSACYEPSESRPTLDLENGVRPLSNNCKAIKSRGLCAGPPPAPIGRELWRIQDPTSTIALASVHRRRTQPRPPPKTLRVSDLLPDPVRPQSQPSAPKATPPATRAAARLTGATTAGLLHRYMRGSVRRRRHVSFERRERELRK